MSIEAAWQWAEQERVKLELEILALRAPQQFREIQLQRLPKQLRVIPVPCGEGQIERIQEIFDLFARRLKEPAAMLLIEISRLSPGWLRRGRRAASIQPKLLAFRDCRGDLVLVSLELNFTTG